MKKIVGFFLLSATSLHAGTPGNSDVWILYGIAMAIFAILLSIDYIVKFIKNKRLEAMNQYENDESNEVEDISQTF